MKYWLKKIVRYNGIAICLLVWQLQVLAQSDSLRQPFRSKSLIAPAVLIATGMVFINNSTKAEQKEWHQQYLTGFRTRIDDYLQFAPQTLTVGLELSGIKGKNSAADKIGIITTSTVIMAATVFSLKGITQVMRPDDSSQDSFPSGHTANAFLGAAILAEEYGSQSVWYSVGGYTAATATGTFRMLNNRHWLSDVLVGAGIGILSAKAAYVVYPWLKDRIHPTRKKIQTSFVPWSNGHIYGGSFSIYF